MSKVDILRMRRWTRTREERSPTLDAGETLDLFGLLRLLRSQIWVVLLTLAVFVGAAFAYAVVTPKIWRASARVLLDPRDKQVLGQGIARQSQGFEPGWVETRVELVKSYDTLARVVKAQNLVDDGEVLSAKAKAAAGDDAFGAAVRNLAEMVLVERPKENYLFDVTVSSRSPEKAARLADAVAAAFVDGLASAKVEQVETANTLLAKQVDEMRAKMIDAEARVEDYKREHGIAVTRGTLVEEETLRQANDALIAARTRMQEARERADRLAQTLKSGDPTLLSQTDPIGSAVISRLKIEAAMAERRKADLEQSLGPRHPRVAAAAAEVERARAQITEEVKSLAATAGLDYQVARANEENARKSLQRAQAGLADISRATVGLQELQNDANVQRDLYKSFVARMEETTLQRNTQVSDARVVSPAQIPLRPFSPRTTLALSLALVAGLGAGLSLALLRGRARLLRTKAPAAAMPIHPTPIAPVEASASAEDPVSAVVEEAAAPAVAPIPVVTRTDPEPDPESEIAAAPVPSPVPAALAIGASEPPIDIEVVHRVADAPAADAEAPPIAETATPEAESGPAPVDAVLTHEVVDADATEEEPAATIDAAVEAASAAPREFRRVTFPISIDRIARLGARAGAGSGARALVEAETGDADADGIARLAGLAAALAADGGRGVRVISSNSVPTVVTAALALGLARAAAECGDRAVLVDLAHEEAALDPVFAAAHPQTVVGDHDADAWERAVDGNLRLLRPLDPVVAGDPNGHPEDVAATIADLNRTADTVVVHLGRQPTAALLFDCAEGADHVTLVVDEKDLASNRISDEIEVVRGLLPRFDGLVVLTGEDTKTPSPAPRRVSALRASERS